jgi:hypothetical protein
MRVFIDDDYMASIVLINNYQTKHCWSTHAPCFHTYTYRLEFREKILFLNLGKKISKGFELKYLIQKNCLFLKLHLPKTNVV